MTAFTVKFTSAFKKNYKHAIRQGRDINRLAADTGMWVIWAVSQTKQ